MRSVSSLLTGIFTAMAAACILALSAIANTVGIASWVRPSPTPIVLPNEANGDRGVIVAGYFAPPLSQVTFGPGVAIYRFTPTWALEDAATNAGTTYVVYVVYDDRHTGHPQLGTLDGGVLRNIPLPHIYASMGLINNGAELTATGVMGGRYWYSLRGREVNPIPRPPGVSDETRPRLSDGDWCVEGAPDSGVAIYDVDRAGHHSPILSVSALKGATKGAIDYPYPVWCTHFHGEDFAYMTGRSGLILRLKNGRASILTTGRFVAVGENDLLIEDINYELLQAHVVSH